MNDLISREEVLRTIIVAGEIEPDLGYTHLHEVIKNLPSTDRQTGKWFKPTGMMPPEHHGHYECSICGGWALRDWLRNRIVLSDYCPVCGARMEVDV